MYVPCLLYSLLHSTDQQMHYIYIYIYKQYFIYRKYSYTFRCICIIFRKSYRFLKTPEDEADASKRVGVLTIHKILLIYICCAFVGPHNKSRE